MRTLAQQSERELSAVRERAQAQNDEFAHKQHVQRLQSKVWVMERDYKAFNQVRETAALRVVTEYADMKIAQDVSGPVRDKAIEIARKIVGNASVASGVSEDIRSGDFVFEQSVRLEETSIVFKPPNYHVRLPIDRRSASRSS